MTSKWPHKLVESVILSTLILFSYAAFCFDMMAIRIMVTVLLYATTAGTVLLVGYHLFASTALLKKRSLGWFRLDPNDLRSTLIRTKWLLILATILLIAVSMLISLIGHSHSFSFDYFRKGLFWAIAVATVGLVSEIRPRPIVRYALGIGAIAMVSTALIVYFLKIGVLYYGNGANRYLVLNLDNPNYLGILMAVATLIFLYFVISSRSLLIKTLAVLLCVPSLILLYATGSRGSLIAVGAGVLIFVIGYVLKWKSALTTRTCIVFLVLLPLLVSTIYVVSLYAIAGGSIQDGLLNNSISSGKSVSTRFEMWVGALQMFAKKPLLGAYYEITQGSGGLQMHNTCLDFVASFGIIAFAGMIGSTVISIYHVVSTSHTSPLMFSAAYAAFFGCFLIGMFEGGIMTSTIRFVAFLPLLSMLRLDRPNNKVGPVLVIETDIIRI